MRHNLHRMIEMSFAIGNCEEGDKLHTDAVIRCICQSKIRDIE